MRRMWCCVAWVALVSPLVAHAQSVAAQMDRPVVSLMGIDEWELSKRAEKRKDVPDIDMLLRVSLPSNPSRSEVINYVNVIYMLSRNQRTELPSDPQVTMLAKVGREHMDILLASSQPGIPMAKYGMYAIALLVQPEDQAWVVKHLPQNDGLVTVLQQKSWCGAATSIFELQLQRGHLSLDGLGCLLQNPKRSYYPALRKYFARSSNAHIVYRMLQDLPGIELREELIQAWEYSRIDRNGFAVSYLMRDVLDAGYVRGFHFLFDMLANDGAARASGIDPATLIMQYSFVRGSKDELFAWYATHHDAIVFDAENRRYVAAK
jgi:hypothetical protein